MNWESVKLPTTLCGADRDKEPPILLLITLTLLFGSTKVGTHCSLMYRAMPRLRSNSFIGKMPLEWHFFNRKKNTQKQLYHMAKSVANILPSTIFVENTNSKYTYLPTFHAKPHFSESTYYCYFTCQQFCLGAGRATGAGRPRTELDPTTQTTVAQYTLSRSCYHYEYLGNMARQTLDTLGQNIQSKKLILVFNQYFFHKKIFHFKLESFRKIWIHKGKV